MSGTVLRKLAETAFLRDTPIVLSSLSVGRADNLLFVGGLFLKRADCCCRTKHLQGCCAHFVEQTTSSDDICNKNGLFGRSPTTKAPTCCMPLQAEREESRFIVTEEKSFPVQRDQE
jgi:hypothetical protein